MYMLFKSEKELNDMKETYESIIGSSESLKDTKIIDLAKKQMYLQHYLLNLKVFFLNLNYINHHYYYYFQYFHQDPIQSGLDHLNHQVI